MPKRKTLTIIAGIAISFIGLAGTIIFLAVTQTITLELAKLMLVALFGLYAGFGFLIVVYRLVEKLD
ncbi:MAG TPA: hypothetical protein VJT81_01480 [Burkholderiales bacterium]|nr:hypothetical protein [Burkholderiales bacterium]